MKKIKSRNNKTPSRVVDLIKCENGISIEVYEDGDCLLIGCNQEFVQLSADTITRLVRSANIPRCGANIHDQLFNIPSNENKHLQQFATPHAPSQRTLTSNVKRSIHKLINQNGWQCTLRYGAGLSEVHVYATRSQARLAQLSNSVGENGRIA